MYDINNVIISQDINKLQVKQLAKTSSLEILSISLEKNTIFPEHTSPRDVQLIVLEGNLVFHINEREFHLSTHQNFSFPKAVPHWVEAVENSKFLIIR